MTVLGDRVPVAPVPVARLAELADGLGDDHAGLLADLPRGRLQGLSPGSTWPLGKREHA